MYDRTAQSDLEFKIRNNMITPGQPLLTTPIAKHLKRLALMRALPYSGHAGQKLFLTTLGCFVEEKE